MSKRLPILQADNSLPQIASRIAHTAHEQYLAASLMVKRRGAIGSTDELLTVGWLDNSLSLQMLIAEHTQHHIRNRVPISPVAALRH